MSAAAGLVAAGLVTGTALIGSGMRARRPDPLLRALAGLPGVTPVDPVGKALGRWNRWVGADGRRRALVLDQPPGAHGRAQRRIVVGGSVVIVMAAVAGGAAGAVWGLVMLGVALVAHARLLDRRAARVRDTMGD
ncbi:MAG: hypothetical protein U0R64_04790 [Candidatus Nanopelagicales bacterium]